MGVRSQESGTKYQARGLTRIRAQEVSQSQGARCTIRDARAEARGITSTGAAQGLETSKLCSKFQVLEDLLQSRPRWKGARVQLVLV